MKTKPLKLVALALCSIINIAIGQSNSQIVHLKKDQFTIGEIFQQVRDELGMEIGYVENEVKTEKIVDLPVGEYTLEGLMTHLFPQPEYKVLIKSGKVLIKNTGSATNKRDHIYGYVSDGETGEKLIGATLFNNNSKTGTTSNNYGYFALPVEGETVSIQVRYLGYKTKTISLQALSDQPVNIQLSPNDKLLGDIVITDNVLDDRVRSTEIGLTKLSVERLKAMPSLGGEPDVLKSIQLLPGVQTVGEGTSAYYVRGGNHDQNLILLDEATVYNPAHALGFFSVFNSDAIKDLSFYKAHIPSEYGGKLSSVLDVRMKDGNLNRHSASGGVGLIASRVMLEGPVIKERAAYMISARRTYADFIWKTISSDEATKNTTIYFYDLNTKLNFKLGKKDHVYLSGFFGRDINEIDVQQYGVVWDNTTLTVRWNHLFSDNLFSNTSLIYSKYNYDIGLSGSANNLSWKSTIEDFTTKLKFDWFPGHNFAIDAGWSSTFHRILPGRASETALGHLSLSNANALEHVAYLTHNIEFSDRFKISMGLRGTAFQNIGPTTLYQFDGNYQLTDSTTFKKGKIFNTFLSLDPRISANFTLNRQSSLKASYNKTSQFIHFVQNNLIPFSAFDQWIISNPNIKPQYAHHFNLGYFRNLEPYGLGLSAEVFYKKMENQLDAADHAQLLLNKYVEGAMRSGFGEAYGLEARLEKPAGVWQGFIGYTYSRAKRTIKDINGGRQYNASYDKPHSAQSSVVYQPSARISCGINWTYSSGSPATLPSETFNYEGHQVPLYSGRNQYRMPAYHRLDLSVTLNRKNTRQVRNESSWVFTLYNTYFRKNASTVFSSPMLDSEGIDVIDPSELLIYKTWLFSIVPSITYNFNF